MGKVSKAKKKKKPGRGWGENKLPKKKNPRIQGKKNWERGGEKIKLQKKTEIGLIRAEKGQRKKSQPAMAQG